MSDIEKLADEYSFMKDSDCGYAFSFNNLKQFAEAYAAKVLEEQSAEIAQLKEKFKSYKEESLNEIVSLNKTCSEYQSNINDLREALNSAYKELLSVIDSINKDKIHHDGDDFHETLNKCEKALPKTPAQHINNDVLIFTKDSLQEHDNEVIEKCAKVCEDINEDGYTTIEEQFCAERIRDLKGLIK